MEAVQGGARPLPAHGGSLPRAGWSLRMLISFYSEQAYSKSYFMTRVSILICKVGACFVYRNKKFRPLCWVVPSASILTAKHWTLFS